MQTSPLPTFRMRLFYVLIPIGLVASCGVALAVSLTDIANTRGFLIENLRRSISLTASAAALDIRHKDTLFFSEMEKQFAAVRGLRLVCIYNKDNHLIHDWPSGGYGGHCPALVREEGLSDTLSSVHIAEPVRSGNAYLGIVYAEGELLSGGDMAARAGLVFASLLLVALLVCLIAAWCGAAHINRLMNVIRQQIECLKDNRSECLLPPAKATRETSALFDEIRSLRLHLVASLVPRETATHLRHWYEQVFFNLFLLLRHRIPADSALLSMLTDCELLLRLNADDASQEPEAADISRILKEAVATARALNPPGDQVHLVVSFKSGDTRAGDTGEWIVQAGLLRALIRHLLLIALARTREGPICLRLEITPQPGGMDAAMLVWRLEDSGPPVQPGVLQSRLTATPYKTVSITEASWMLVVLLTKRLGGAISGGNIPGGLLLRGEVPLRQGENGSGSARIESNAARPAKESPRLVLMVGEASGDARRLYGMLESLNCGVIWAENYIQALELVPVLPFSAIVLHEFLFSQQAHAVVRQTLELMKNKLMSSLPVWVVTASEAIAEHKAWSEAGVSEIVPVPAPQEKIASLCRSLPPFNARFWSVCDMNLLKEYSTALEARLPELRTELKALIRRVQAVITDGAADPFTLDVIHQTHTVKSAALALGYMHIAGLMANLEYMLASGRKANTRKNIAVIAGCLKDICLE